MRRNKMSVLVTAFCNQLEAFASDLSDNHSRHLLAHFSWVGIDWWSLSSKWQQLSCLYDVQCSKRADWRWLHLVRKVFDSVGSVVDSIRSQQSLVISLFINVLIWWCYVQILRDNATFWDCTLHHTAKNTTSQQGIHRHQTPPWSHNATRCARLRDTKSTHGHKAHYGQRWCHT